jgi:hypothetical protein
MKIPGLFLLKIYEYSYAMRKSQLEKALAPFPLAIHSTSYEYSLCAIMDDAKTALLSAGKA